MSFKHLFSRSLGSDPARLHLAAHSHHLWPDASFDGHAECWHDAARLADRKWDRVMDEIWPEAQRRVATELGTGMPDSIVFSSNTHDFIIRLAAACPRADPRQLRVLTTDGEFHSARRQFARWEEDGWLVVERVRAEPFETFSDRFLDAAGAGGHDVIMTSHVLFGSGRLFERIEELASLARPEGPWVVVDGYHAFMAVEAPLPAPAATSAFYLGGGYKYAMAGEGCAFLHAPPGFGDRPPVTGWFAEFGELTAPPGGVGYTNDSMRFMGATFDPSALYRFVAVQRMLQAEGLTTARVSSHVAGLQEQLLGAVARTPLAEAELLNPLDGRPHARFLAFRSEHAGRWSAHLKDHNCITDHRGDVLRIGIGIYNDEADVERFAELAASLD